MHEQYMYIGLPDDRVVEEACELIHAIVKAKRFGWLDHHPKNPSVNNVQRVISEMNDLRFTLNQLEGFLTTTYPEEVKKPL